jgi:hypothetical protein
MHIGTAARQWNRLDPTETQWTGFREMLGAAAARLRGEMELCYEPFDVEAGLERSFRAPPATLLVLPNGWVKVAAALPHVCADLRKDSLEEAWQAYRRAWRSATVADAAREAMGDRSRHAQANIWRLLPTAVA